MFGSTKRPGMRGGPYYLGSLSGTVLGDDPEALVETVTGTTTQIPTTAPATPTPAPSPSMSTGKKALIAGGIAAAAYFLFLRK